MCERLKAMKQGMSPTATRRRTEAKSNSKFMPTPRSLSSSTNPSWVKTSASKPKDSPKPDIPNGKWVSPSPSSSPSPSPKPKPRANSVPLDTNLHSNQKAKRSLFVNKPKSGDTAAVGASGSRPAGRPRQLRVTTTDPNSDSGKRNETLIRNLQSEVLELKAELDKARSLNTELQSLNRKLSEDLASAEARISILTIREQRESVVDDQSRGFKDIQKLIATKLEHSKAKNEATNDASPARVLTEAPIDLIPGAALDVQRNFQSCHLPPPPPPPPLPPPPARHPGKAAIAQKAPVVVEFYHSLTRHDRAKYHSASENREKPVVMSAHSSIVGEIQKRSAHHLAVKADIETKGEFIKSLIQKVLDAAYTDIEDLLKFVDWLDSQLLSLADERAVLKHFDWPEKKADAMREAAVEYRGLKLVESVVSSYEDNISIPCGVAMKKMASLLDRSEQSIQRLIKLRKSVVLSYQHLKIPTDWMLDSGIISKIKQASMMLAKSYMNRVMMELESAQYSERESTQECLLLQGVHFAYRAHQFAGGLDSETLCAFEEIRQRVPGNLRGSQELLAGIPSS